MKTTALITLLTLAYTAVAPVQEFPEDLFADGHNYAASVQFDKEPSEKITAQSEAWKQIQAYVNEDLKKLGLEPQLTYLRSPKGKGGLAKTLKEKNVRCLLSFTFFKYKKKGGDRSTYAGGKLDITAVDEEGKKTSRDIRFTIGGDGSDKLSYTELIAKLKEHLEELKEKE